MILHEELSEELIGACIEVHRELGPGLLESCYEACLCHELVRRKIRFRRQVELPVRYKDIVLDIGYRIDLIVDEKIVVEVKAVEKVLPVHEAQLLTYLRLTNIRVGLLINFNSPVIRSSITRRVI